MVGVSRVQTLRLLRVGLPRPCQPCFTPLRADTLFTRRQETVAPGMTASILTAPQRPRGHWDPRSWTLLPSKEFLNSLLHPEKISFAVTGWLGSVFHSQGEVKVKAWGGHSGPRAVALSPVPKVQPSAPAAPGAQTQGRRHVLCVQEGLQSPARRS